MNNINKLLLTIFCFFGACVSVSDKNSDKNTDKVKDSVLVKTAKEIELNYLKEFIKEDNAVKVVEVDELIFISLGNINEENNIPITNLENNLFYTNYHIEKSNNSVISISYKLENGRVLKFVKNLNKINI